jgi:outer membrane protein assembly factor BamB
MFERPSRRRFLAGLGAAGAASLAGCADAVEEFDGDLGDGAPVPDDATADWPSPHFDAQCTSYNPRQVGPTSKPTERWRVDAVRPTGRIAVVDDTAYVPTSSALLALDAASGKERWRVGERETEDGVNRGRPYFTSPAVVGDTVYAGTTDGRGLLALGAGSGEERWRYTVDDRTDVSAAPCPTDEGRFVAVGTERGRVALLDAETGDPEWTFDVFGRVTKLAAAFNLLYVGTEGGEVYALYSGRGLWRRKLPGSIRALAVDGSSTVYAGTFGGGVFRLMSGAHAGRTRWHAEEGPTAHGAFALADGILVGTDLARARGLHHRTGDVRWSVDGDFGAPPAASGSMAYLGGEEGVVAVALDGGIGVGDVRLGATQWTYSVEGTVQSGVTVADDALFVATSGGEESEAGIYALE